MNFKTLARLFKYLVIAVLLVSACNRYEDEFNEIQSEIAQIKEALSTLQDAYNSGKFISSITPVEGDTSNGWMFTFSDNTSITVSDYKDGVTPYIKVNEENFWCVSYDGGATYETLLNAEGNPIPAVGSLKVIINEAGYYVIETYDPTTGELIDSIVTTYSSNPQSVIQSIVNNDTTNTISITMESGDVFTFKQMVIYPSSIVLFENALTLTLGEEKSIEFLVNPSNAVISEADFQLNLVRSETKSEVSYVTTPSTYSIKSVEPAKDQDGNIKRGQYVMTIKDAASGLDYNDKMTIVIATKDSQANQMEISSELISISSVYTSSLARVIITTPDGAAITSKTKWLENTSIRIIGEDGSVDLDATTSIRGRGNTTWNYPKKPYALKLDSKAEVLGMPKHKRWVLLANWMDRTLLRNDISLEMARRVMAWASRGQFVEVYLNGVHQGNYYLCEHIKVDKNRVNIDKLDEETDFNDPEQISGGYILEFDEYGQYDEPNFFWSKIIDIDDGTPVSIKEPDEEVITSHDHPGFLYIQNYIHNIEDILEADKNTLARWNEIEALIDVTSYIDWWFIHELATNLEPNQPRSCYMYKARNGKLYAGPVWDFDYRTFDPSYNHFNIKSTMWYIHLFRYPEFKIAMKERWAELEETFRSIDEYIVSTSEKIRESNEVNLAMWPISSTVNGDESMSYDDAIARMRAAYQHRLTAVGGYISTL